jgi:hypothetical protein
MPGNMAVLDFETIDVGEEYGPLSYVLTSEKLATFRQVVGDPEAVFPTIASKDYANLFSTRYEQPGFVNAKHESWYLSPPDEGETITTTGRLADKYVRRGRAYLVVATRSVGADQRPIVRSKTTLTLRGYQPAEARHEKDEA